MMNPVRARTTTFRKRAFFASILLLFVGVLGSCGDPNSSPPGEVGGIETWTVAEEPSVVIGGADEREEYVLHRVVTATRLSDGRIVIANGGSEELKYFDAQGRHLFNAGGRGDGPGELRLLSHMARLPGDSILVLSLRPGLTHFGPDGEYVASRPLVLTEIGDQRCRMSESNWFVQSDGSIVTALTEAGRPGCPESAENPRRLSSLVGRYSPERDRFDTLALVPGPEYDGMFPRVHGGDISLAMTSGMVYVGDTGSDGILVFDLRGGGRSVHRVPFEPVRIPPEAKEGQPPPPPPGRNGPDPRVLRLPGVVSSLRPHSRRSRGAPLGDGLSGDEGAAWGGLSHPSLRFQGGGRRRALEGSRLGRRAHRGDSDASRLLRGGGGRRPHSRSVEG